MAVLIVETPIPSGPLKLENVVSVHYCGERIDTDTTIWICRCGDSSNAAIL
jgi:CDGSH-type Zn-finger protein